MESYGIYGHLLWVILLFLLAVCFFLIGFRNRYYFKKVKNIMGCKKTEESELYSAIDEINNTIKGAFSIIDYVDVSFHGNAYKLFKGTFASTGPAGEYGFTGMVFSSNYICSLDEVSSANAMEMKNLLELKAKSGNRAIFTIKNIRRLKNEIEKEGVTGKKSYGISFLPHFFI